MAKFNGIRERETSSQLSLDGFSEGTQRAQLLRRSRSADLILGTEENTVSEFTFHKGPNVIPHEHDILHRYLPERNKSKRDEDALREEARRVRGTRRGKKSHVTRLVNQINQHIEKRLSRKTLASLKLDLEKAVSEMENVNQILFEFDPDDDEPETWIEQALAPVLTCFENIERYYLERISDAPTVVTEPERFSKSASLKTKSSVASVTSKVSRYKEKVIEAKLLQHDLEAARKKESEDQKLSELQAKREASLRQTKAQVEVEIEELQRLNEDAMRVRKLRELEETVERAILEAKLIKEVEDTPVTGRPDTSQKHIDGPWDSDHPSGPPLLSKSSPSVVPQSTEKGANQAADPSTLTASGALLDTAVTNNQPTMMQPPTSCAPYKDPWTKPRTAATVTTSNTTPLPSHEAPTSQAELATPVAQNSPWRGWGVPSQTAMTTPRVQGAPFQPQATWSLIPAFPGPPQDAWIDELDEFSVRPQSRPTPHRYCSFSALERSLPKFDLGKFGGSPLDWPLWIGRFKSIVHDQPFLNDNQRLTYLQNAVTGAAKSEIQFLGEDGSNYILALRMLKTRFADSGKIVRAAIVTLKNTPSPHLRDHAGLAKLHQTLRATISTLHRQRFIADLLSETNLSIAVEKLPDVLASKWAMEVQRHEGQGRPNLFDLDRWLSEHVRARQHLEQQEPAKPPLNNKRDPLKREPNLRNSTLHVSGNTPLGNNPVERKRPKSTVCPCCDEAHPPYRCEKFKSKSARERFEIVKDMQLCLNCLKGGHQVRECPCKDHCRVTGCKKHHHTLLHFEDVNDERQPTQDPQPNPRKGSDSEPGASSYVAATNSLRIMDRSVYFQVVPVQIQGKDGVAPINTFAILDDGSSDTLIRQDIADQLQLEGPEQLLSLGNVEYDGSPRRSRVVNLVVTPTGKQAVNKPVPIHGAWTVPRLNVPPVRLVRESIRSSWKHLQDLDIPAVSTKQIGLLIGVQVVEAMIQHEWRQGPKGQPYAVRTDFGWAVAGAAKGIPTTRTDHGHVGHCVAVDSTLHSQVEEWWKTESFGTKFQKDNPRSAEDEKALERLENTTHFRTDLGHYETGLLWKDEDIKLPNNRILAERRLSSLERSLDKDKEKSKGYYETLETYIAKGYARKLSPAEAAHEPDNTWYLPHHAVTNPNKPGKVRVVFDAAASHKGTSLNDRLVTGPDLLNSLVGVIMRFRLHAIAMIADIETMFFQVRVIESDQPSLRFLWRGADRERPPEVYQMQAMIFGAKSSPSCASYCLRKTAIDNASAYSKETISSVLRDFYMDDLLKSLPSEEEATKLAVQLTDLLSRGGFRLTKFMSNSRTVLAQLPPEDILGTPGTSKPLDLDLDHLPVERALGILWNVERDTLEIKAATKQLAATKRGILKQISTIFDPLGLVAPFVLRAKLILQELWRLKYDWDDPISGPLLEAWIAWKEELPYLANFSVPRCYLSDWLGSQFESAQLHIFADASEVAFGAAAYWRFETCGHSYQCAFVFGKARLAPVKPLSIPRLELQAA